MSLEAPTILPDNKEVSNLNPNISNRVQTGLGAPDLQIAGVRPPQELTGQNSFGGTIPARENGVPLTQAQEETARKVVEGLGAGGQSIKPLLFTPVTSLDVRNAQAVSRRDSAGFPEHIDERTIEDKVAVIESARQEAMQQWQAATTKEERRRIEDAYASFCMDYKQHVG